MYKYCRQGVKIKNPRPKMVFFFRARNFLVIVRLVYIAYFA